MRHMRRAGMFRDSYIYSDIMYSLAAFVSETISKSSWEKLMIKMLFKPLHMNETTFFNELKPDVIDLASAYVKHRGLPKKVTSNYFREASKLGGAQSVMSNAVDMAKWMLFILSGKRADKGSKLVDEEILGKSSFPLNETTNATQSTRFKSPHFPHTWYDYGQNNAWREGMYRGQRVVSSIESGRSLVVGYQSHITLVLSSDIGVFTTSSGKGLNSLAVTALHAHIVDVMSGMDLWLNSSTRCSFPAPWISPPSRLKSRQITNKKRKVMDNKLFVGVYYNSIYGRIIVFENKIIDRLQLQYGAIRANLHPLKARGKFRAKGLQDFWLFRITCIFTTKPDKSTSLSIPDFVPNYPTNPISFKYTVAKIPKEYLFFNPNISNAVSSVGTTDEGNGLLVSLSTGRTPKGTSIELTTPPDINVTISVPTITSEIVSHYTDQSTHRLQETDHFPASANALETTAMSSKFETIVSTLTQSITATSMEFSKMSSSDIASSQLYPRTHISISSKNIPSTTDKPRILSSVSTFYGGVSQNKNLHKEAPAGGIIWPKITLPSTEEAEFSTEKNIITTQVTPEVTSETDTIPGDNTYTYTSPNTEEIESTFMTSATDLTFTTESHRITSSKPVQDVIAAGQTVSSPISTKIQRKSTTHNPPNTSEQLTADNVTYIAKTRTERTNPHSVTVSGSTDRSLEANSITRSGFETTTGLSTSQRSILKDTDNGILNSDTPNIGTSNYFQKRRIQLCHLTTLVILLWL